MTDIPVDQIQTTFRLYKICVTIYNFQYKLQQIWDFHCHTCRNLNDGSSGFFFFFYMSIQEKRCAKFAQCSLTHSHLQVNAWQLKYFFAFRSLASIYHPSFIQHCRLMYNITVQHCSGYLPLPSPSPPQPLPQIFPPLFNSLD